MNKTLIKSIATGLVLAAAATASLAHEASPKADAPSGSGMESDTQSSPASKTA